MKTEYKVRTVTRYVVTRYHEGDGCVGSDTKGEFDNGQVAYQVAYALAKEEHQRLGYPPGDMRIIYPEIPDGVSVPPQGTYASLT
jgi:hypothetical protein